MELSLVKSVAKAATMTIVHDSPKESLAQMLQSATVYCRSCPR
jgi:hypothetical protein